MPLDPSIYSQLQPNVALGLGDIVNKYVDQTQADALNKNKLAQMAQQGQLQDIQLQQARNELAMQPQKLAEAKQARETKYMQGVAQEIAANPEQKDVILNRHAELAPQLGIDPNHVTWLAADLANAPNVQERALFHAAPQEYMKQQLEAKFRKPATSDIATSLSAAGIDPSSSEGKAIIKEHYSKPQADKLVQVIGADGVTPVLVPSSQAAGMQPFVKGATASSGVNENSPSYKAGLAELKRDETVVQQGNDLQNAYNRWVELNSNVETGPISGRRPISWDPAYEEMQQLQNYFSMNNFKPGQGQMSNAERVYIRGAGPQTTNKKEVNESIIGVKLGALKNQQDMYNFKEWRLQNKGNLLGANKEFQDYIEKNPRFVKDKNGELVPNENRVDWTDYFQGGKQGESSKPTVNPLTVTAPDGSVHTFPSKAAADGFRKAIGAQ